MSTATSILPPVMCVFCHTLIINRTIARASCNNCNVNYYITTNVMPNVIEPVIYMVTFYFKNNDIKYRISLWPWKNQTHLYYDGDVIMGRSVGQSTTFMPQISAIQPILTLPQLFWIFPETLSYWKDKFIKLMVLA